MPKIASITNIGRGSFSIETSNGRAEIFIAREMFQLMSASAL